jgi:hypothetical protein
MKTYIQYITPEQAAKWLEKNNKNPRKKIIIAWVQELMKSLRRGEWVLTHQGIAFDRDGNLVDGQHRLTAIVQTGIGATLMITEGVPSESISEMDLGLRRNAATRMNVDKGTAEPITFIARIIYGMRPTTRELEAIRDCTMESCKNLLSHCMSARAKLSQAPVKAAFVTHQLMTRDDVIFREYRKFILLKMENIDELAKISTSMRALFSRLTGLTENRASGARIVQASSQYIFAMTLFAIRNPEKKYIHHADTESTLIEVRKFYRNLLVMRK